VSGVSRRRVDDWICLAVHALLIRSPNWLPLILVALYGLLGRRHGGARVFLLRAHCPYRYLRDGYRILICQQRLFCLSCPVSSSTLSYPRYFFRPSTAMARKKITVGELSAPCQSEWLLEGYTSRQRLSSRPQQARGQNSNGPKCSVGSLRPVRGPLSSPPWRRINTDVVFQPVP
jgi:hypothetical protein